MIVGFTATGDVVVNDPAASSASGVRRTYDRGQFEAAWLGGSGGTAYVIHDAAHPLPAVTWELVAPRLSLVARARWLRRSRSDRLEASAAIGTRAAVPGSGYVGRLAAVPAGGADLRWLRRSRSNRLETLRSRRSAAATDIHLGCTVRCAGTRYPQRDSRPPMSVGGRVLGLVP